jgi:PAS domain S-box-containing protein
MLREDPPPIPPTGVHLSTPAERPADRVQLNRDEVIPALEARERFLDAILGSLGAFLAVDADWRLTYANRAAAERAGAAAGEILGKELWEAIPDLQDGAVRSSLQRAMAERESVELEAEIPPGRAYHARAYPLADGGLAVYIQDVSERLRRETEREQLAAALALSEQSFAAVFEVSPFAMSLTEMPSGRILRVNRAFEELLGYSRDELIGLTDLDLGIADPGSSDEVARRFAADKVVRDLEVVRTTRAGDQRILSLSLDWVTLGRERSVLTSIRDVTELRRAEQTLVASEQRYRSIVETTAEGIMIGDPDGAIVYANQRMADMLGYTVVELVGMEGPRLVYPDWLPKVEKNREALRQGDVLRGEFKLRRRDGSALWTVFSSTPLHDQAGAHVGNLTMHTDISERRASEEARRESEQNLRSFYDSASLLMGVAELDGERIVPVSANRAAEELLGDRLAVTPREGVPPRRVEHALAGGLERELVRRYLESEITRRPVRFEHELGRGGDARLLSFTVAHIAGGTSGRPRFSFVAEDITERRRAEDALRERDREQAAREEKSRVARDLHDSVTQALFAASLKAEALTGMERVPADVEAVVAEVQRLNRGALAQMRTMLLELRGDPLEQIPLQQLLRNVVEATESRTRTRVGLRIEGERQVPPVVHVTLYRVTQEALNNVARHAQADHASVELRLLPGHALLTVKDDGRGFVPGPLGPAHLGLRSMRERAAEAGARLSVTSAPGAGTEVTMEWEAGEQVPSS